MVESVRESESQGGCRLSDQRGRGEEAAEAEESPSSPSQYVSFFFLYEHCAAGDALCAHFYTLSRLRSPPRFSRDALAVSVMLCAVCEPSFVDSLVCPPCDAPERLCRDIVCSPTECQSRCC